MNSKEIEILINHWEGWASHYWEQAEEFNVPGYEVLRVEFCTIANTLERCANDLKNNRHSNDG